MQLEECYICMEELLQWSPECNVVHLWVRIEKLEIIIDDALRFRECDQ